MEKTREEILAGMKQLLKSSEENILKMAMVPAANELLAETKNRIVLDGKKTDGNLIGHYSTKSMYASKDQFVKKGAFKNVGKTGDKTKSSMYLPGGYKQFRSIQGRQVEKIDESLSGNTMASYQLEVADKAILLGMVNQKASKIRKGQDKKFGSIFASSVQELTDYQDNVTKSVQELQRKALL